jgi:hypothetical protein
MLFIVVLLIFKVRNNTLIYLMFAPNPNLVWYRRNKLRGTYQNTLRLSNIHLATPSLIEFVPQ